MKSVAIVGGGITGLTAAFRLQEQGHSVTLFERGSRTGGAIQTVRDGEYLAECGPNTILDTAPEIGQLIEAAGVAPRRLNSNPEAESRYILRGGNPVAMPSSPLGFFSSPLFSAQAKLRLLAEPFLPPSPEEAEENLAEFVVRRLGQEFLDYAINPFVAGVYAGDPARLSVRQAFPKLHALEQKYGSLIKGQVLGARERKRRGTPSKQNAKKVSFDEGLQVLTDALATKLGEAVRLETDVTHLQQEGEQIRLTSSPSGPELFDAVLLALPAFRMAALNLEASSSVSLQPLGEITYPPVASIVLGFHRSQVAHSLDGFGTLNPEVEQRSTLGTIFSSSLFPGRAPSDHVLLTSYVGGMRSPQLAQESEEKIIAGTLEDLRSIYGIQGDPTYQHCFIYPRAIPQYEVGYQRFKDLMAEAESSFHGLFIAGHCRDGISLGDSIVSGHRVAGRISDFWSAKEKASPSPTQFEHEKASRSPR